MPNMPDKENTAITATNHPTLLFDGAMGSVIQRHALTESDYRGMRFLHYKASQLNNNELLCLTAPDLIRNIHREYIEAGADVITTNSFMAQRCSMRGRDMGRHITEINQTAARLAREEADACRTRHVRIAGSVGPTSCIVDQGKGPRNIRFTRLKVEYKEQITALIDGGVDIILLETFHLLANARAALEAFEQARRQTGRWPEIVLSVCPCFDGKLWGGDGLEEAIRLANSFGVTTVGINCIDVRQIGSLLTDLRSMTDLPVYAAPSLGIPNADGSYPVASWEFVRLMTEHIRQGLIQWAGGCCGTSSTDIRALGQKIRKV